MKPKKSAGPYSICPELVIYAGAGLKSWLRSFFIFSCLRPPKFWRRKLVAAVQSLRNRERIHKVIVRSFCFLFPTRSLSDLSMHAATHQTLHCPFAPARTDRFSTQTIHRRLSHLAYAKHKEPVQDKKKKACAACVDLTAAYDTVWHSSFTYKLRRLLSDKHMARMTTKLRSLSRSEVSLLPPMKANLASYDD